MDWGNRDVRVIQQSALPDCVQIARQLIKDWPIKIMVHHTNLTSKSYKRMVDMTKHSTVVCAYANYSGLAS